jgi:hypothetical protein
MFSLRAPANNQSSSTNQNTTTTNTNPYRIVHHGSWHRQQIDSDIPEDPNAKVYGTEAEALAGPENQPLPEPEAREKAMSGELGARGEYRRRYEVEQRTKVSRAI